MCLPHASTHHPRALLPPLPRQIPPRTRRHELSGRLRKRKARIAEVFGAGSAVEEPVQQQPWRAVDLQGFVGGMQVVMMIIAWT